MYSGTPARNLLINGAMQISQRAAVGTPIGTITTSGPYITADRWKTTLASLGTWTQTTIVDAPTGSGFRNSFKMACTTANASPIAGAALLISQEIEGQNLQAIRKGTASAQPMTLSFWVKSFQTGTYICELTDNDNNRSVSKSYTITASATWQYVSILFPADTTGVFDNDNNGSLSVNWWLGAGSTFTSGTLATTWATVTSANRAVGQTNVASSTNNYWFMTGAQLTIGSVAVPFQFKSFADDLRDCHRYYVDAGTYIGGTAAAGYGGSPTFYFIVQYPLPVPMRATPTMNGVTTSTLQFTNTAGSGQTTSAILVTGGSSLQRVYAIYQASGYSLGQAMNATATAGINASAEL
jgi:hypothetical protein